jgi:hypothetical protein
MCPNCARQGQKLANISKGNQKQPQKRLENQHVKNNANSGFSNIGLKIHTIVQITHNPIKRR